MESQVDAIMTTINVNLYRKEDVQQEVQRNELPLNSQPR
jgi:hypothetical protein